jgi:hypothetical protein
MTTDPTMTRQERRDLLRLTQQRERLARAQAGHRSSELLADFEEQLSSVYAFDQDATWREAYAAAEAAVGEARRAVAARCEELGIPAMFAPSIDVYWSPRGQNTARERRAELRAAGKARIAEMERAARVAIEGASLRVQERLLTDGLTSDAARAFLAAMPTAEALMPPLVLDDVALLPARSARPLG